MQLRCLIVDDNQAFLEAARVLLEREGLAIAGTASNSAEALRKADTLRPDVVLVDLMLGKESGFELARLHFEDHVVVVLDGAVGGRCDSGVRYRVPGNG